MTREWQGLDKWPLDKYLYLVRVMVCESLQHVPIEDCIDILRAVLQADRAKGLALHIVDVILDEIVRAQLRPKACRTLLHGVVVWAYAEVREPIIHKRLDEWVLDPIAGGKLKGVLAKCGRLLLADLSNAVIAPLTLDSNRGRVQAAADRLSAYVDAPSDEEEAAHPTAVTSIKKKRRKSLK